MTDRRVLSVRKSLVCLLMMMSTLVAPHPAFGDTPTTISQCESLSAPGNYIVTNDLVSTSPYICLSVGGTGVHIDCQGYSIIGAVAFANSTDSSVSNCDLIYPLGNPVLSPGALIEMLNDSGDVATNNIINGSSQSWNDGADDGIILGNATNDQIIDNNISDTFDTGIETDNFDSHNLIQGNTISNEDYAGIGGWWFNSWLDNTVKDNTITDSPEIFEFDNYCGAGNGQPTVYFKGNRFVGNVFSNPKPLFGVGEMIVNTEQMDGCTGSPVPFVAKGNVLKGNNFGTTEHSLALFPARAFKDGGGNICNPADTGRNYPIVCHSS